MRLDVCDECNCYLKTYTDEDEEKIYLRDWTTLHLDLLAEEKISASAEPLNWIDKFPTMAGDSAINNQCF